MAGARDYKDEYRRRNERAQLLGFPSESARRKAPRRLRSLADVGRMPEGARASRSRVLGLVQRARAEVTTVEVQAELAGVWMWEVRYWAREALQPARLGETHPRAGDRILRLRPLVVDGEEEVTFVPVRGSRAAERADAVFDVQWRVANDLADESELDQIRGVRIAGQAVESDAERLHYLARAKALDTDEVYWGLLG
jgi:hypothetical protein